MENTNLKFIGNLSDIYNNLEMPKDVRKHARITALKLFEMEFPVKHKPKPALTSDEIHAGITQGKIAAIRRHRERTSFGLRESKDAVEKYFQDNGLTFGG